MLLRGGIKIETKSAQYPERLGSVAPDLIVCCEAGQISDETRIWLTGRTMEKRGQVFYTGTLEDEGRNRQWAWYIELGSAWMEDKTAEHSGYSLPSWDNDAVFPGGRADPEILLKESQWKEFTGSDFMFMRRIAGVPTGVQYQVYPQLDDRDLLRPLPYGTQFARHFGGCDYGTVHPTALDIVGFTKEVVAWVRECAWSGDQRDPGDRDWLLAQRARLRDTYHCWEWATDPNERYLARSIMGQAVSITAREPRIGLVQARLNSGRLYFDINGPGVPALYEEMRRVHRYKTRAGEVRLDRKDDDRTAALEDAMELSDAVKKWEPQPMTTRLVYGNRRPRREFSRFKV